MVLRRAVPPQAFLYGANGTEPFIDWLCGPEHADDGADAGAKARREFVADTFLGFAFDLCIPHGGCYAIRGANGGYDAAALCLPPGVVRGGMVLPWWRALALVWRAGLPPAMRAEHAAVFGDVARRLEDVDPHMIYGHNKYASGAQGYVQALGTRPGVQARGLGAALLAAVASKAAAACVPVYLECCGDYNVAYYSRRGFMRMEERIVQDEHARGGVKWNLRGYAMLMQPPTA